MTAKHIALHGQPVPDALYESMHALVEKTEVYRNPFFHPQFINAVSLRKFITNGFVHSDLAITDSFETELNCEAFIETSYEDFYQVQKKEHNSQFKRSPWLDCCL